MILYITSATKKCILTVPILLVSFGCWINAAAAQSCSANMTNLNFGSVDVTTNTAYSTAATLSITCTGIASATVTTCTGFGGGSGGINGSGAPRYMASGSNLLSYEIYTDAAHTTVWGSAWTGGAGTWRQANITLNSSGSGSTTLTAYGLVFSGQQSVVTGSYLSNFSAADVNLQAAYSGSGCGSYFTPPTFSVLATTALNCNVSATDLNFGSAGVLNNNIDSTSTISVSCINGAPYNVGLSIGSGVGATVASRKMTGSGSTITYALYKDVSRSTVWGNTVGVDTVSGTGIGSTQNLIVYGRVPPQSTPAPGVYLDTIVVTVTY
jgi:spore coat protein U-like protein